MPIRLKKPTTKEFPLSKELREKYNDDPEAPTLFAIRQATHRENSLRDAKLATFERIFNDEGIEMRSTLNLPELAEYELWLTMASCNIEDEEGNPIFRFKNGRLALSFKQFRERLGLLPSDIVTYMHEKVLEVNPQWGPEGKK